MSNNSYFSTLLREINQRAMYVIISWCICFIYCYFNPTQIIYFIVAPLSPSTVLQINSHNTEFGKQIPSFFSSLDFIYTNVSEAFYATLSACFICSMVAIIPLIVYQSWCFLMPSRYQRERALWNERILAIGVYTTTIMWLMMAFLFPRIYTFLHLFAVSSDVLHITLEARIAPYLTWIFLTGFLFLLLTWFPIVIYIALKNNVLSIHYLLKNRRTTLYLILICAAFVSPPDIWSQFVLTLFGYIFFECVMWYYLYTTVSTLKAQKNVAKAQQGVDF